MLLHFGNGEKEGQFHKMLKESKNSVKPRLFAEIGKQFPKVSSFIYLPPLYNDFWYIACKRKTEKPHMGLLSSGGKNKGREARNRSIFS